MPADPRSVLTRPACAPDAQVRYGEHPDQIADIRLPATGVTEATPLVIVVHGGFWRAEYDRSHTGPLAADLAARGYLVAQLEYRRTGQGGGWPATFDDVAAGVQALPGLVAATLGRPDLGNRPAVLLGHSAGGHLALWCAAELPERVAGVLALAPVADLAEAYRLNLDEDAVAALLGAGPDLVPDRYARADPARRVPLPVRTVIVHGAKDLQVPIEISRRYVDLARTAGSDISLVELPEAEHFGLIDPESQVWTVVTAALHSLRDPFPRIDAGSHGR
ncbi:MAG TPA: alpha/beta hydrolase [Micromonosporaceae bacterium]